MLKLSRSSITLNTRFEELTRKRPWCWEGLGAGGEGDDRGWDGWMTSQTPWAWVWQALGVGDGQGSLACCSPWGRKESDMTEWLNSNNLTHTHSLQKWLQLILFTTHDHWRKKRKPFICISTKLLRGINLSHKSFCLIFHSRQSSLISLLNFFLIFQFQVNSYQPPPNSPLLWKTSIHSLATCQAGKFLLVFALHVLTFTICALIGKAMFVHKMNLACWV